MVETSDALQAVMLKYQGKQPPEPKPLAAQEKSDYSANSEQTKVVQRLLIPYVVQYRELEAFLYELSFYHNA